LDIASVNSAALIEYDGERVTRARLCAGGVAPVPLFLDRASAFLPGKAIDEATVAEVARLAVAETSPISDVRGSAEYKRLLLRQLMFAHFFELFPELLRAEVLL
jgi:xanthine dehydrogenase small subunit